MIDINRAIEGATCASCNRDFGVLALSFGPNATESGRSVVFCCVPCANILVSDLRDGVWT